VLSRAAGRHTPGMADISILDTSVRAAPKGYVIHGAQEIVLKGVSASFDGTGAAGSYVPAVQVIDPSGFTVGTYVLGQTLAAGASADVAWFPGVKPAAATTGTPLETTNTGGTVTVNPTTELLIGAGITLTNPGGAGTAELVAAGGGGGWDFNQDNNGGYGQLETTGTVAANFANARANKTNADEFSLAFNAENQTLFTAAPDAFFNTGNATVEIQDFKTSGDFGSEGLEVIAQDTTANGSGTVTGVQVLATGDTSSNVEGVIVVATGGLTQASDVIGVDAAASNRGTGKEIGASFGIGGFQSGANSLALRCVDSIGNPIFEVRSDGSLHGKTGQALTFDL
jgi:hypothetical protein